MEHIDRRLADAATALAGLDEVAGRSMLTPAEDGGALRRLDDTFAALWQAARLLLSELEGVVVASPGAAVRAAREVGWLDPADAALALLLARRSHAGERDHAEAGGEIAARLHDHTAMLRRWLTAMREHSDRP